MEKQAIPPSTETSNEIIKHLHRLEIEMKIPRYSRKKSQRFFEESKPIIYHLEKAIAIEGKVLVAFSARKV